MLQPTREDAMRPIFFTALLFLTLARPTTGDGQAPVTGTLRQSAFEALDDRDWVRLSSPALGRRQGRMLEQSPTELILSSEPQPVRIPTATIDTLWTRGYSTKTGAIVGALLGAGVGALAAASLGESDTDRGALWAVSLGGGTVGGGLVGMLIGTALPRWKRRFP
jgi:hypothetical protein